MAKNFKRFYLFLLQYKNDFAIFAFVLTLSGVVENITPYFFKLLVDNATGLNYVLLVKLVGAYVGVRLLGDFLGVFSFYLGDKVLIPAAKDVRSKIFKYIQDLDFAFHVNKNTGSLISAFKRGDGAFFNLFHSFHFNVYKAIISLLVALFFFSRVSPLILIVMVAMFAVNMAVTSFLIKLNLKRRKEFNDSEDNISAIITDNLLNYETVKFFAQEKKEENRLSFSFIDWVNKLWGFSNSFRVMDVTIGGLSGLGMFLVLWITIRKLTAGEIGVGDFVMVSSFMTGFYYRFFDLLYQFRNIAKNFIDLEKYFELLDNKIIVKDPSAPLFFDKDIRGEIEFKDVDFKYPGNRRSVLEDVTLKINPGETVAFVGKSGAGKTTILKLLLRFYDLKKGKIFIDGVDITKMNKSYLRSFMGVVPQEPVLFNNTIKFNIGYGKEGVDMEEIRRVVRMANLEEFIESLPEKYETQVGERGIKLSGGQKQRLAIARALLVDPKIIIFDEATSNLDSESEKLVQDALWKTAKNRTVLIIAHRFSTIRKANKIVVLDKGRVAEVGTHAELLKKEGGVYRKLWHLQAKGKLEKDEGGLLPVKDKVEEEV